MSQCIAVLGSTGSIGTQTLEVVRDRNLTVAALAAGTNTDLLLRQILEFCPRIASVAYEEDADRLRTRLRRTPDAPDTEILWGREGNRAVARCTEADTVVAAMVGMAGLEPVLEAIRAGKDIALANKETLVAGGSLVVPLCRKHQVRLLPVDSEHSAIWQCLRGSRTQDIRRILLTASGGPFRTWPAEKLKEVRVADALDHPTWKMGGKITVDSATLMNKGLEVIEASWLFDVPVDRVEVVVHPQSIIHSMVEFRNRSVLAQMGFPDMKLPIQIALTWPDIADGTGECLDPFDPRAAVLTFEPPDRRRFPCLDLAYAAGRARRIASRRPERCE